MKNFLKNNLLIILSYATYLVNNLNISSTILVFCFIVAQLLIWIWNKARPSVNSIIAVLLIILLGLAIILPDIFPIFNNESSKYFFMFTGMLLIFIISIHAFFWFILSTMSFYKKSKK